MQPAISKFRNVYGEAGKDKYEDVKSNDTTTEGLIIDSNANFVAVSWVASGGGCVSVFDATKFTRFTNDLPMIKGHTAAVSEVKFSPFRSNLLATGSEDGSVRLWEIPEGGLTEDIKLEQQKFTGHSKKVQLISFSPTVIEVIASASFDNTVNVWNICNGASYFNTSFADNILSLNWNHNGSLLGLTTKAKSVYVVDPRGNKIDLQTHAHDSVKSQKMGFLDHNLLYTCGFGKSNDRQIKLFDMRKFTEPVQTQYIDTQSGIMMPYYDSDTGLIFLPGKGEGLIKFMDFSNSTIKSAGEFRTNVAQKSISFFPKRSLNYNKCEIVRAAKLTNSTVEYVSFYVPRRNEGYDSSIYPECLSGESALEVEEWIKGDNREPLRKNITELNENKFKNNEITFEKKVELNEEKKSNHETDYNPKVAELEKLVKELQENISQLQLKNSTISTQLEQQKNKTLELQAELNSFKAGSVSQDL